MKITVVNKEKRCAKCRRWESNVVHCNSCCGWGVTAGVKYHKFVPVRASRRQPVNSRGEEVKKDYEIKPVDRGWWCPTIRAIFPNQCNHSAHPKKMSVFVIVVTNGDAIKSRRKPR